MPFALGGMIFQPRGIGFEARVDQQLLWATKLTRSSTRMLSVRLRNSTARVAHRVRSGEKKCESSTSKE